MELQTRRWVARLIQFGLILVVILLIGVWTWHRTPRPGKIRVQRNVPTTEALAPGDLRVYNEDSTVDIVLQGDKLLAGLSPKVVEKVRSEMEKNSTRDTSGLGGLIAQTVKQTVSSAIGTHVVYPLSEIRDIQYQDGQLILVN